MTIASSLSSSGDGFRTLLTCPRNEDTLLFIVFAVDSGSSNCEHKEITIKPSNKQASTLLMNK
jgi:hypothetical protein